MKRFIVKHPRFVLSFSFLVLVGLAAGIAYAQLQRSVPKPTLVEAASLNWQPAPSTEITWPAVGEAGVSIEGAGIIGESPDQEARPIASLVKVMTAYIILKHHPLSTGEPGPDIQFQQQDVQDYLARRANSESVVAVAAGSKMTERDVLRGLLLASGNNLADVLAEWDAGSVGAFVAQMNAEAASLGMTNTRYADAAGLMPESVSTAHDQMLLANAAMGNEAFASIVKEQEAVLPGAGVVYNTNSTLGSGGIVGIKTGWTEYAGACFLFAAQQQLEDRTVTIVGAVLGQNTLADAYDRSRELITIAAANVNLSKLGSAGDVVGQVKSQWGETSNVVLASDASIIALPGMQVDSKLVMSTSDIKAGSEVGSARFSGGDQVITVPIKAESSIKSPSILWRLERLR